MLAHDAHGVETVKHYTAVCYAPGAYMYIVLRRVNTP